MDVREQPPLSRQKFQERMVGDSKRWSLTVFSLPVPWPCCSPAIKTPPRPVPAGPLISWPKNASCSRIPPWASRASVPPRRRVTTCCRLALRPCNAPLSCSLQPLLKLSLLSLGPVLDHLCSNLSRLFHFCWITEIRSLNLCVCFYLFLFCLCLSDRNELQL